MFLKKMVWVVLGFSFSVAACCLAALIAPNLLRRILEFFSVGSRLYIAAVLRITLGILFLVLASQSRLWGYVVTIGIIAAASGVSIFFLALKRTKKLLARIQNQSDLILRLYATAGLAIWALLIYSLLP